MRAPATFALGLGAKLGSNYSYDEVLNFSIGKYEHSLKTTRYLKRMDNNIKDLIIEGEVGKITNLENPSIKSYPSLCTLQSRWKLRNQGIEPWEYRH